MTEESYKKLNVDEVLEAIQNEGITAQQALDYELSGKKRKTLLDTLNELLEPAKDDVTLEVKVQTQVVIFNKNVKYGKLRYKRGEKTEVSVEEYNELLKAGVIQVGD